MLIATTTTLAFVVVVASGVVTSGRQRATLAELEGRLVPKLAFGPRLEAEVARVQRAMQDAVAAQDMDALHAVGELKEAVVLTIDRAGPALEPEDAAALRAALDAYYVVGRDVSRRLIAGETGETLAAPVARMQRMQRQLAGVLDQAVRFEQGDLTTAFAAVRSAAETARSVNLLVGLCALVLVIALSFWASRTVLEGVRGLATGFARFATGDFGQPIPVATYDELGTIASEANRMAESLRAHAEERARIDWLRTGQAELADELRGELDPIAAAQRAIAFLVRRVEGAAGAIYLADDDALHLSGHFGMTSSSAEPRRVIAPRDGFVGEAFALDRVLVVNNPPPDYLRVSSGLGDAAARALAFVPLARASRSIGALEIAFFGPCTDRVVELLSSVRELLAVTLEAARSQTDLKQSLAETQRQAERLAKQEEELRHNNNELRAQQDELQQVNEELEAQRAELRAQNAALDSANREVQKKADEVAKVSSYKSQFLANMSHELRTPLNSMLLLSQLMAENEAENLTPKQVEYCQTIHGAGKDLMSLINQVLDLAKIESGKQGVYVETVPLSSFVGQAKRMFAAVAAEKQLAFDVELAAGLPDAIDTDRRRVEQVLINLLGNAIKFTAAGRVALRIYSPTAPVRFQRADLVPDRMVAFAVSDTGIGIPVEAQEAVFLPFEQLEAKTDRRYGGTGLGLAIARESVALLGGELHVESAPGQGSTFTCYLPLRLEAKASVVRATVAPRSVSMAAPINAPVHRDGNQLLIIEDDVVFAEVLADIARSRDLHVTIAHSGEEGLRLAVERKPRGIVLDVKLPDVDGWTVMERLRRDPSTASIPVHFVSALDASERGLAMGAVGYLVKPSSREQLQSLVHTVASAMESAPSRVLVVEDDIAAAHSVVELLGNDRVQTLHVRTASAAIEALARERFSCMLLDLGLPDVDGLQLLASLRGRQDIHTPPVIVYTARSLTRDEVRLLEEYAEAVVVKDGSSEQRLLDEVHLFVQHLKDASPPGRASISAAAADARISLSDTRILVVDDDMRTLYALSALLRSKGAEVLAADNGRAALDTLEQHPSLHCVLMDIMMPEMDGYEAMRRIRAQPRFAQLPVVALTAKAMKGERERCIEAGASDYHPKPVDGPLLLTTINGLIRGG